MVRSEGKGRGIEVVAVVRVKGSTVECRLAITLKIIKSEWLNYVVRLQFAEENSLRRREWMRLRF